MDFSPSPRAAELTERVRAFMAEEIEPVEGQYHRDLARLRETGDPWTPLPVLEELKKKARAAGLWNLFLPAEHAGTYAERLTHRTGRGSPTSTTRRSRSSPDGPRSRRTCSTATPRTPGTWRCC
ncbi:MAG: hypothetical protein ACXVXE_13230 [Nocardioidaceae bacterium]